MNSFSGTTDNSNTLEHRENIEDAAAFAACIDLTRETLNFDASGGAVLEVGVSTTGGAWDYETAKDWINIERDGDTLKVDLEDNTEAAGRSCSIFVDGCTTKEIVIFQQGTSDLCDVVLNPAELVYGAAGGVKNVNISTSGDWSALSLREWITATKTSNNNVAIDLEPLPSGTTTRECTVVIEGCVDKPIRIVQSADGDVCTLTVSESNIQLNAEGTGSESVTVTSSEAWTLTGVPAGGWLTADVTDSGIVFSANEANTSTDSRTVTVTVDGCIDNTITVTQAGATVVTPCTLTVSNDDLTFAATGEAVQTITVTTTESDWTAEPLEPWVIATKVGDDTIEIYVQDNPEGLGERECTVRVNGCEVKEISLLQEANTGNPDPVCSVDVDENELTYGAEGGTQTITVTASDTDWVPVSMREWIRVETNGNEVSIILDPLGEGEDTRECTVVIDGCEDKEIIIIQEAEAAGCSVTTSETLLTFGAEGGEQSFTVESTEPWSATPVSPWVSIKSIVGNTVTVEVQPNDEADAEERDCGIVIEGCELVNVDLTQAAPGTECSVTIANATEEFAQAGETKAIAIASIESWTASLSDDSWLTIQGETAGTLTLQAAENTGADARTVIVTITGCEEQTFTVTQPGFVAPACEFTLPSTSYDVVQAGETLTVTIDTNNTVDSVTIEDESWVTYGLSGNTLTLVVSPNNASEARTNTVTVAGCETGSFTIVQAGTEEVPCSVVAPASFDFVPQGETETILVTISGDWDITVSNDAFFTATKNADNTGIIVSAEPNNSGIALSGSITINACENAIISVTQLPLETPGAFQYIRVTVNGVTDGLDELFISDFMVGDENEDFRSVSQGVWRILAPPNGEGLPNTRVLAIPAENAITPDRFRVVLAGGIGLAPDNFTIELSEDGENYETIYAQTEFAPRADEYDTSEQYTVLFEDQAPVTDEFEVRIATENSTETFTVQSSEENAIIMVYDGIGKFLYEKQITGFREVIDNKSLASGVYFIMVTTGNETVTKRWVVK